MTGGETINILPIRVQAENSIIFNDGGFTIINGGKSLSGDQNRALVDGQLAVDCFGDDILPSRIGLADSTVAKLDGILTGVSAAAGGSDALEGHALGSVAGVAGDRLFLTVIGHGLAVRGL